MLDKFVADAALYEIETEVLHLKTICNLIISAKTDYLEIRDLQELFGDLLNKSQRIEEATERMREKMLEGVK